jgi:poly-gamma-glutamate system protein
MLFWASSSKDKVLLNNYDEKVTSAEIMNSALTVLKNYRLNHNLANIDTLSDPNYTYLIGKKFGPITIDNAHLSEKQTSLNPNFAALFIDLLKESNLQRGDSIAISLTGSYPGLNIAILSACKTLKLNPVIITSVGSSQWGANNPDFTWLEMEDILLKENIFPYKSIAASIGGKSDIGKNIGENGRDILWASIYNNKIPLIYEDSLSLNIEKRLEYYTSHNSLNSLKAYINIGDNSASIGQDVNANLIPQGVSDGSDLIDLYGKSVVKEFANMHIPIIHIHNLKDLQQYYAFPWAPIPLPTVGEGDLYFEMRYNIFITLIALILASGLTIGVGIYSHKQIKERVYSYEPDSIL